MAFGWESHRLRLVPLDVDRHFENCYRWMNTPEVTAFLLVGDFPISKLAEKDWFEEAQRRDPAQGEIIFAIELLDGTHIGQSGIHGIDWRNGFATTGSLIGDLAEQGKGYGTEAAQLRAWYCFHVLGLRLLRSEYLSGNDRSKRMQEKTGYLEVGRIPQRFWKRGEYRDDVVTVLTRERWLELSQGEKSWTATQ